MNRFVNDNGLSEQIDVESFYKLSKSYGIDGGYALAVFIKETGWGKHSPAWINGNNPAGITCGLDYCSYNTKEDGIESMFQLLRKYVDGSIAYIGKRTTAIEVREKWCETKDIDEIIGLWKQINGGK
ncbi:glucosaminidase domain-containing protein [Amedibacillus sp. YH-ame6]